MIRFFLAGLAILLAMPAKGQVPGVSGPLQAHEIPKPPAHLGRELHAEAVRPNFGVLWFRCYTNVTQHQNPPVPVYSQAIIENISKETIPTGVVIKIIAWATSGAEHVDIPLKQPFRPGQMLKSGIINGAVAPPCIAVTKWPP